MGPSVVFEKVTFLRDGVWRERRFTGLVTFLTGPAGIGKSTPLEALFYILGLDGMAVMPEVRSCEQLQLFFRVAGTRWSAARRGGSSGHVVFTNLDEKGKVPPRQLPVKAPAGEQSASDFVLGLLDLPVFGHDPKRLGLRQLHRVMMLRQKAISNTYLDGLADHERELLFEVLLGLRDEELDQLEGEFAAADNRHKERRLFRNQFLKQREIHNLDSPVAIREEAERKQQEQRAAAEQVQAAQRALGELAAVRGKLDFGVDQAKAAFRRRQQAADQAGRALTEAESAFGQAKGMLAGLVRRAGAPTHCSSCGQGLPERERGHCRQCDQPVAGGGSDRLQDDIDQAKASVAAREVAVAQRRRELDEAAAHREAAWEEVQRADAARQAHERDHWRPQQQLALEAEKKASALGGEVTQLARRLEEVQIVFALDAELKVLEAARKDAKDALDAARSDRAHRRKDIIEQWSQLLLARVREVDPRIESAYITADFMPFVDNKPFDDSSVSGGPKTLRNICTMLSLRDLGRVVPGVRVPPLLIIDAPASGFGSQGVDARISARLLDQMIAVAADPSPDGYACQIIAAVNDPLPGPRTGVREIALGPGNRFFDDAPVCEVG